MLFEFIFLIAVLASCAWIVYTRDIVGSRILFDEIKWGL